MWLPLWVAAAVFVPLAGAAADVDDTAARDSARAVPHADAQAALAGFFQPWRDAAGGGRVAFAGWWDGRPVTVDWGTAQPTHGDGIGGGGGGGQWTVAAVVWGAEGQVVARWHAAAGRRLAPGGEAAGGLAIVLSAVDDNGVAGGVSTELCAVPPSMRGATHTSVVTLADGGSCLSSRTVSWQPAGHGRAVQSNWAPPLWTWNRLAAASGDDVAASSAAVRGTFVGRLVVDAAESSWWQDQGPALVMLVTLLAYAGLKMWSVSPSGAAWMASGRAAAAAREREDAGGGGKED